MQNLIEIKNLTFKYDAQRTEEPALENVSLSIERGSFTVILGHNGSGKSTLAKLMNGLLVPQTGSVCFDGICTDSEENIYKIRRKLGMVFQNPDNQIVCTVVEEDVAFGPENLGIEPSEIRKRVDSALQTVGMSEFALASPYKLSGGQKQRVALAGILAMEPECIILDEPTAMLDPIGRRDVINTVTKLNREEGITVVLITHFMEEAENADRIIIMDSGKITADGKPGEIFSNSDVLKSAGLSLPQSVELLKKLKENGISLNDGVVSVKDAANEILHAVGGAEK